MEFLDIASRPEISRVSVSTNGLRCATDYDFCQALAEKKVYVNLQLDALSNPELRVLRGTGDYTKLHGAGSGIGVVGVPCGDPFLCILDVYDGGLHID